MQEWLEGIAGPGTGTALMWTIFALIGLLVLLILIRIVRGLTFGTFVSGGRNRKARLAVMDATAVDSHRRLVLVRRDDVEHLILIGGPSDVVVEQNIRLLPPARRPPVEEAADYQPLTISPAAPAERPRAAPPEPPPAPRAAPQAVPAPPPPRQQPTPPVSPVVAPPPSPPPAAMVPAPSPSAPPVTSARPVQDPYFPPPVPPVSATAPVRAAANPAPSSGDLDDALFEELEVTLDNDSQHGSRQKATDRSLDEEMDRLLNDLSGEKR